MEKRIRGKEREVELEERVAFGDERGVVKAVCDLGLIKYLHGVYATIAVASDL